MACPRLSALFEPLRTPTPVLELEVVKRMLLEQLDAAITQRTFPQEGLTIGQLVSQLEAQEHRLRRLITTKMGFRNFNDFLNHYRVRVACQQLANLILARTPILTIVMKPGYGSIGPFNRTFKRSTGLMPIEYSSAEVDRARLTSRYTGQR